MGVHCTKGAQSANGVQGTMACKGAVRRRAPYGEGRRTAKGAEWRKAPDGEADVTSESAGRREVVMMNCDAEIPL